MTGTHYRQRVMPYYRAFGSRLGYTALLGRTRHFGWYEAGDAPWRFAAAMRRMEVVAARKLALPPASSVLDAGCGVGDTARTVARVSGVHVTGIDGIESDIVIARRRSADEAKGGGGGGGDEERRGRTRFLRADYHALPFANSSFDGVYTMESFVHSPDLSQGLAEFFRVLRPGGKLVMFEYSSTPRAELTPAARSALLRVCDRSSMPGMLTMTHGELGRLLGETGFTLESVDDVSARILPMLRSFSTLGWLPYTVARGFRCGDRLVNAMSGVEMYRHQNTWRYTINVATKQVPRDGHTRS
ncbi:class I SAM-dependent methyltransferase [Streptomyces sp. NPDC058284]|uniref:class I SAM-dependent methyltransferase n=1 Tax=unclassified Streptomyces TaxID=2593676 RepID=UPI00365580B5